MEVVKIGDSTNIDAIDLLEETIASVRSGEVVAVSVSWVTKDGAIGGDVSGGNNGTLMWASIEHSARSFYNEVILGSDT